MRSLLLSFVLLSLSGGALSQGEPSQAEISPELGKGDVVLAPEPIVVSTRTGIRTKEANIAKMHGDGFFNNTLGASHPYCSNWYNDLSPETQSIIKFNCKDYGGQGTGF